MSDDLDFDLKGAFRAVKDTYDGASPDADLTLHRALFASRAHVRRRRVTQWFLVPIAAALFASTAWAGATGRLAPVVASVRDILYAEAGPPPPTPSPHSAAHAPLAARLDAANPLPTDEAKGDLAPVVASGPNAPVTAAGSVMEPDAPEPNAPALPPPPPNDTRTPARATTAKDTRARSSNDATATVGASARPASANDAPTAGGDSTSVRAANEAAGGAREASLFAEANRIHFVEREPARALAAWDRYLAAAPNGSLAPEARYNRAIALVRVGRTVEARTELETFANGSYRRAEARALLDALARDAGP